MNESYDIEPWMPAVSPGAPLGTPPRYKPFQFSNPRQSLARSFAPRPEVPSNWKPFSELPKGYHDKFLKNGGVDVHRGVRMPEDMIKRGVNPQQVFGKTKINAGDYGSLGRNYASKYAAYSSQDVNYNNPTKDFTKTGKVITQRLPAQDLYYSTKQPIQNMGGSIVDDIEVKYVPRGTPKAKAFQNTGTQFPGADLKSQSKKAVYPTSSSKPMTKPGMVTGRMPMLRGMGGGMIDMFMEGPELQKAKSDPTYGIGREERRNLELAHQYGL